MLIEGAWLLCPDEVLRPVIRGEVQTRDGSWVQTPFLVDIGADRSVFSANILQLLQLPFLPPPTQLGGAGGSFSSVVVDTKIQLPRDGDSMVVFGGQFAGATELETLDMSILGRDITNLFAVIADRPGDRVCLVGQRHQYTIHEG
jgi:hypothetical protein